MIFSEETYGLFRTFICPFPIKLCRYISHPLKMGDFWPKAENDPKIPYLWKCPWRCHHGAHCICHLVYVPMRHGTLGKFYWHLNLMKNVVIGVLLAPYAWPFKVSLHKNQYKNQQALQSFTNAAITLILHLDFAPSSNDT